MATLELAGKLRILIEARERLEAELERNEHWRALHRAEAAQPPVTPAQAEQAHLALAGSPLYKAWLDVNEAVALVQNSAHLVPPAPATPASAAGADAASFEDMFVDAPATVTSHALPPVVAPTTAAVTDSHPVGETARPAFDDDPLADLVVSDAAPAASAPSPMTVASLAKALEEVRADAPAIEPRREFEDAAPEEPEVNLPPEMAALIRAEATAAERAAADNPSEREMRAVGQRATRAVERLLASIPSVEPLPARRTDAQADADMPVRRPAPPIPTAAAAVRPAQTQTPSVNSANSDDLDFLLNPAGAPWTPFDEQEPEPMRAPTRPAPVARREEPAVPPVLAPSVAVARAMAEPEEAEVTVVRRGGVSQTAITQSRPVTPEPAREAAEAAPPARTFRRFFKALTGH